MAFSSSRTITIDTVADPDETLVLEKINQDANGLTYFKKTDSGDEYKIQIRRNLQNLKGGGSSERHIVDMTWTVYSDLDIPTTYQAYTHLIVPKGTPPQKSIDALVALSSFTSGNASKLVGWET